MMPEIGNISQSTDPRRIDLPGRVLVAHQAEFMPWLGFISKATMGDVFLILDDTQYNKRYFENRNKIRFPNKEGWIWLNIPIKYNNLQSNMLDVIIDGFSWKKKHLKTIKNSYSKAPYFDEIYLEVKQIYDSFQSNKLVEFNIAFIEYAFRKFKINIPVHRVSMLKDRGYKICGTSTDLVVSLCLATKANTLIAGMSGKDYLDLDKFEKNMIIPVFQKFIHPVYRQYHGGFLPYMSFIDLLFNHGSEKAIEILGKSNYTEK